MKDYRAVGRKCAVDFNDFAEFMTKEEALPILKRLKFKILHLNVLDVASSRIGISSYKVGAEMSEAPGTLDCSSFVKWCYGKLGIWLPRRAVQQKEAAEEISMDELSPGDLVFTSGNGNYYNQNPFMKIGHVGIATGRGSVIHASAKQKGVLESTMDEFLTTGESRGAGRVIPKGSDLVTLEASTAHCVETSDDVRWLIAPNIVKAGSS